MYTRGLPGLTSVGEDMPNPHLKTQRRKIWGKHSLGDKGRGNGVKLWGMEPQEGNSWNVNKEKKRKEKKRKEKKRKEKKRKGKERKETCLFLLHMQLETQALGILDSSYCYSSYRVADPFSSLGTFSSSFIGGPVKM
jgi:hypothetical protein